MGDFTAALRRYFSFSGLEVRDLLITAFVFGFLISFREWGGETFQLSMGVENLLKGFLIATIALFFKYSVQRAFALKRGYALEFALWPVGILIGLLIVFVTRGYLPLLLPAGIVLYHMGGMRLGRFRYGLNMFDVGLVSLMGPLANGFLAVVSKALLFAFPENLFLEKMILVNAILAVTGMLPIPLMDGGNTFFGSRTLWAFGFAMMAGLAAALYFLTSVFGIILAAFILGIAGAIAWHSQVEP